MNERKRLEEEAEGTKTRKKQIVLILCGYMELSRAAYCYCAESEKTYVTCFE